MGGRGGGTRRCGRPPSPIRFPGGGFDPLSIEPGRKGGGVEKGRPSHPLGWIGKGRDPDGGGSPSLPPPGKPPSAVPRPDVRGTTPPPSTGGEKETWDPPPPSPPVSDGKDRVRTRSNFSDRTRDDSGVEKGRERIRREGTSLCVCPWIDPHTSTVVSHVDVLACRKRRKRTAYEVERRARSEIRTARGTVETKEEGIRTRRTRRDASSSRHVGAPKEGQARHPRARRRSRRSEPRQETKTCGYGTIRAASPAWTRSRPESANARGRGA